jgi:hypothetical protein
LGRADGFGHIGDVDKRVHVQVGPVPEQQGDIGPRPGLDGGGDARLEVVDIDELEDDLGPERFGRLDRVAPQNDIGLRDEVVPPDDV